MYITRRVNSKKKNIEIIHRFNSTKCREISRSQFDKILRKFNESIRQDSEKIHRVNSTKYLENSPQDVQQVTYIINLIRPVRYADIWPRDNYQISRQMTVQSCTRHQCNIRDMNLLGQNCCNLFVLSIYLLHIKHDWSRSKKKKAEYFAVLCRTFSTAQFSYKGKHPNSGSS